MTKTIGIRSDAALTGEIIQQIRALYKTESDPYKRAKVLARDFLGARVINKDKVLIGYWVPGLKNGRLEGKDYLFELDILTPKVALNFESLSSQQQKEVEFDKFSSKLTSYEDIMFGVFEGVNIGTKENLGAFYMLRYKHEDGRERIARDPLAQSVPFGIYAPAEIVDIKQLLEQRSDMDYFKSFYREIYEDGVYRAKDIGTTLEIHVETATKEGTLQALTDKYKLIAEKLNNNIDSNDIYSCLSYDELNYVCYDTIELTPEVPPAEREGCPNELGEFFEIKEVSDSSNTVTIGLKKPNISDWGYDTPIIGTAAVNPSILATGRPHEFLEFIETLHTLPGKPIQLSLDSVLGHADFQGAKLLETFEAKSVLPGNTKYINSKFFRGANMYGRDINYAEPMVRAILLEMYQRKVDFGFDCVRVDGGQDFVKEINPETGFRIQDDDFINEMVNIYQDINGIKRRLDFNVEDGRPWPNDMNWLYNATYIEHTMERTVPYGDTVKQWGPLIFAHNVHGKFKWFQTKWDRFKDNFKEGENWITGHSNHDNARYFYRLVFPTPGALYEEGTNVEDYYNDTYGNTLQEVTHKALDNNALNALVLGFLPGNPMFFLNTIFHTPWLFFRDIDDQYGVKVVADEGSRFLTWYISDELYNQEDKFVRLKHLGFKTLSQLVSNPLDDNIEAFMDVLFRKHELIKTDPVMVLALYDSTDGHEKFETVQELEKRLSLLFSPKNEQGIEYRKYLNEKMAKDPIEIERLLTYARKMIQTSIPPLKADIAKAEGDLKEELNEQLNKMTYLSKRDDVELALLIVDSATENEYNIDQWAIDPELMPYIPEEMKTNGVLTAEKLKEFARCFMLDARDASKVSGYEHLVNRDQAAFALKLRQFRDQNPWLTQNPTNNIKKDFFSRKIVTNGAKDTGAFFSDKGDIINANTIYSGWRTSPDGSKQVFFLANMEGRPLKILELNYYLPMDGQWNVVAKSPGLKDIPETLDRRYVFSNFHDGEAIILERSLS